MRAKLLPVGCAAPSEIKYVDAGETCGEGRDHREFLPTVDLWGVQKEGSLSQESWVKERGWRGIRNKDGLTAMIQEIADLDGSQHIGSLLRHTIDTQTDLCPLCHTGWLSSCHRTEGSMATWKEQGPYLSIPMSWPSH